MLCFVVIVVVAAAVVVVFQDRVSLCSPGYPEICSVDQGDLGLRYPPASGSRVLELKACVTTTQLISLYKTF